MIVVAIIGILAAIAIPAYSDYTRKARVGEISNSAGALMSALNTHVSEQGVSGAMDDFAAVATTLGLTISTKYISDPGTIISACADANATASITLRSTVSGATGDMVLSSRCGGGGPRTWTAGTTPIAAKYLPKN